MTRRNTQRTASSCTSVPSPLEHARGKPVKPSITLRWLHKQQLLHVNEKLPVDAFASVQGCYPISDMCGTSQIMSHTRGNYWSSEKRMISPTAAAAAAVPSLPCVLFLELMMFRRMLRMTSPSAFIVRRVWVFSPPPTPVSVSGEIISVLSSKLTFPPPPSTHLRWELAKRDNPRTRGLPHRCSSAHMDPLETFSFWINFAGRLTMDRAALVMLFLFPPSSTQLPAAPHLLTAQQPLRRERGGKKKKNRSRGHLFCALWALTQVSGLQPRLAETQRLWAAADSDLAASSKSLQHREMGSHQSRSVTLGWSNRWARLGGKGEETNETSHPHREVRTQGALVQDSSGVRQTVRLRTCCVFWKSQITAETTWFIHTITPSPPSPSCCFLFLETFNTRDNLVPWKKLPHHYYSLKSKETILQRQPKVDTCAFRHQKLSSQQEYMKNISCITTVLSPFLRKCSSYDTVITERELTNTWDPLVIDKRPFQIRSLQISLKQESLLLIECSRINRLTEGFPAFPAFTVHKHSIVQLSVHKSLRLSPWLHRCSRAVSC